MGVDIATLGVKVEQKGVKETTKDLKELTDAGTKAEKATGGLASAAVKLGGAIGTSLGVGKLVYDLIAVNKEFGQLKASLTTVTGSASAASAAFSQLEEFATQTPYQLTDVTNAYIRLKSLGLDASNDSLKSFGNTASAMGKDMMQFIEAVADATSMQFERLKDFGVRAEQEGENVKFTFNGITTAVKKDASEISAYLKKIGDTQFAGAMEEQMKTLGGAISNLKDSYEKALREIGEAGFTEKLTESVKDFEEVISDPEFIRSMSEVASALSQMLPLLAQTAKVGADAFNGLAEEVRDTAEWWAAYSMGHIGFWEWMFTGQEDAAKRLEEIKKATGIADEEAFEAKRKKDAKDKAKAALELADAIKKAQQDEARRQKAIEEASIKKFKLEKEMMEDNIKSYEDYYKTLTGMAEDATRVIDDRYKALQETIKATAALIKGQNDKKKESEKIEGLDFGGDAYEQRIRATDELARKEAELQQIISDEIATKGEISEETIQKVRDLQNAWTEQSSAVEVAGNLIITQAEAVEKSNEAIQRLGDTVAEYQRARLQEAEQAALGVEVAQMSAVAAIENYKASLASLEQNIAALTKDVKITVIDNASTQINTINASLQGLINTMKAAGMTPDAAKLLEAQLGATKPQARFGMPYVPKDGMYYLHQGERVTPVNRSTTNNSLNIRGGINVVADSRKAGRSVGDTLRKTMTRRWTR